jgi:hypothetical protein
MKITMKQLWSGFLHLIQSEDRYVLQKDLAARHAERRKSPSWKKFERELDEAFKNTSVRRDCPTAAEFDIAVQCPESVDPLVREHILGCGECQRDLKVFLRGRALAGKETLSVLQEGSLPTFPAG